MDKTIEQLENAITELWDAVDSDIFYESATHEDDYPDDSYTPAIETVQNAPAKLRDLVAKLKALRKEKKPPANIVLLLNCDSLGYYEHTYLLTDFPARVEIIDGYQDDMDGADIDAIQLAGNKIEKVYVFKNGLHKMDSDLVRSLMDQIDAIYPDN